jgi:hypothetical protein
MTRRIRKMCIKRNVSVRLLRQRFEQINVQPIRGLICCISYKPSVFPFSSTNDRVHNWIQSILYSLTETKSVFAAFLLSAHHNRKRFLMGKSNNFGVTIGHNLSFSSVPKKTNNATSIFHVMSVDRSSS